MENVSSEEELLKLRNEGKITEDEYGQLLGVMKRTDRTHTGVADLDQYIPIRTSVLAVLSLVFSILAAALTGFIWLFVIFFPFVVLLFFIPLFQTPGIILGHLARRQIRKEPVFQGNRLAAAGLIIGYTIFALSLVGFLFLSFIMGYLNYRFVDSSPPDAFEVTELRRFALDNMEGLIARAGVKIDKEISSDGNGSLRIDVTQPTTVRLFETGDMDIENARLIYQAKVRTENLQGKVYLEMWCSFPGKGEFFSKGLMQPLTGNVDWTTLRIPFLLKKGENPDNIKLNLVIEGGAIVWIDDIRLIKYPLD